MNVPINRASGHLTSRGLKLSTDKKLVGQPHQPTTIYLRQAGLACSSKFCYLYSVWCRGQDAVTNSRPIANIYVICHFKTTP